MPTQFLDLTNKLLRRLNEVTIDQSDFMSARGVQAMAKDAINAAVQQISQYEPQWPFTAMSGTQILTAGTEEYDWPTDLKMVNWRSFFIQKDDTIGNGGTPLLFISRDLWYKKFKVSDQQVGTDGRSIPQYVFEKHGYGFGVTPSPNEAYTVEFDYYKIQPVLSAYSDLSLIPTSFDEVIIQGSLYHFYMFRDNSQQAQQAEDRFKANLQHMRTVLINKENRIRSGQLNSASVVVPLAEPLYPL